MKRLTPSEAFAVNGSKGGNARRDKLSPKRRSEIARNAALARHKKRKEV